MKKVDVRMAFPWDGLRKPGVLKAAAAGAPLTWAIGRPGRTPAVVLCCGAVEAV